MKCPICHKPFKQQGRYENHLKDAHDLDLDGLAMDPLADFSEWVRGITERALIAEAENARLRDRLATIEAALVD